MKTSRAHRRRRMVAVAAPAAIALLLGACGSGGSSSSGGGSSSGGSSSGGSSSGGSSSGGSTAKSSSGGVSFTYGYYGNAEELQVYKKAVQLYEKQHPNVHISTQFNAPAQFLAKLPLQLRAGNQPDVVNVAESWVSLLQSTFHDFVDLTPYIKKDNISQSSFVPGTWAPGALEGKQLMLPNIVYGDAVAINENIFKKDHISMPGKDWTSSELLADAKKATSGSGSSKIWGVSAPLGPGNTPQLFGGHLFNDKTNKMTATNPKVKKAIKWVVDLVQKDKVTPVVSVSYAGNSTLVDPFLTGHAAMDVTYASYDQASFDQEIGSKFKWTLVPWPSDMNGVLQLNATSIFKGSSNPPSKYAAEFEFIKWLSTNPSATSLQAQLSSPAYKPALQQWLKHPPSDWANVNRPATIAALARSPYAYDGRQYTQVWTMLGTQMSSMIAGKESTSAGIAAIQSQGTSILSSLQGQG